MTFFRGLLVLFLLIGCQKARVPTPEPAGTKQKTERPSEVGSTSLALPSSSLIVVSDTGATAFSPTGLLAWTFKLPAKDRLIAKPVAAPNSYLYLRGARTVYAVGPEGRQVWASDIDPGVGRFQSLVVLTDSSVVAVIGDATLTCLTTMGTARWTYKLPEGVTITGEPTSAPNGFLLLRTKDRIYALNSDGQLQWTAVVPAPT